MGGAPTKAWATVVNKAYENGVVLVTAAGNSWYRGLASASPKRLLYPARWDNVIAATGVAYNKKPYVMEAQVKFKGGSDEDMQGNHGPESAMKTALAAYTPNTTWATLNDKENPFSLKGGGTSSATPQIAAAAALYIVNYRQEIETLLKDQPTQKWKKVEMVKNALFSSADKSYAESKKYFGQGTLRAFEALNVKPTIAGLKKAEAASVMLWGILDLLGLLVRLKSGNNQELFVRGEMFGLEILQEMHTNPHLHKFLDYEDTYIWSAEEKEELKRELLASNTISERLRNYLTQE
jgi:subtilisin family serine protease